MPDMPEPSILMGPAGMPATTTDTENDMTAAQISFILAACSWTPCADGLSVAELGAQREAGAVGPFDLYLARRRKLSGRGYEYGLAWVRGAVITSHSLNSTYLGSPDWPWEEGCSEVVTWYRTRQAALAAALG